MSLSKIFTKLHILKSFSLTNHLFKDNKVEHFQESEVRFHQGNTNNESNFEDESNFGSSTRLEGFKFSDETIRQGFIRRVYSILVVI